MNKLIRRTLLTALFPVFLLISACDQASDTDRLIVEDGSADMAFSAPDQLLSPRAINRDNLVLRITIGTFVTEVRADENGEFRLVTQLPSNTSTQVTLEWFEIIGNEALALAIASKPLFTGTRASPAVLEFRNDEFDTSIDDDNDGFSNLVERRDGFQFDDPNSPVAPPVLVTLNVELNLPRILQDASGTAKSQLFAEAFVNGSNLFLSREGDVWRGQAVVTENTSPLVRVNIHATAERRVRLVDLSRSRDVGSGGTSIFAADDYQDGLDPLNDDGDKFNNAEEIANGTDPGDDLDPDFDGDNLSFGEDNCPNIANPGQQDIDDDGLGDACDEINNNDLDNDGVANENDNCRTVPNPGQGDRDNDGTGDACDSTDDSDSDGDGVRDEEDNCPGDANSNQADLDGDGIGNVCDNTDNRDGDDDGVPDVRDNCPTIPNANQANLDGDPLGDACDDDRDGDTVPDAVDNCPAIANANQANADGDGFGDACDETPNPPPVVEPPVVIPPVVEPPLVEPPVVIPPVVTPPVAEPPVVTPPVVEPPVVTPPVVEPPVVTPPVVEPPVVTPPVVEPPTITPPPPP